MIRRIEFAILGLLMLAVTACAGPVHSVPIVDSYHADSVCVDHNYIRVPEEMCAIGDYDDSFMASPRPYGWVYHPYQDGFGQPYAMPYVGYPVERSVFVDRRPINVTTINIRRGPVFPAAPPAGRAGSAAQIEPVGYVNTTRTVDKASGKVETVAAKNKDVARGGLGAKDVKNVVAAKSFDPKRVTPPPASSRPMAKAKR